jgi:excisionase family DNA binding protein
MGRTLARLFVSLDVGSWHTALEEYLTIAETAALLKVSRKRVQNLMCEGVLKQGEHFFRPPGLGARFKRSALMAWIERTNESAAETITLKRGCVLKLPSAQKANGL